ncbi:MAG: sensor domain-containing diguanylate cyclase [Coriobacteriia bacterium]|nr:sensor domain-containing diguanylate cyclase [Coriobacteriia bacterium]
MGDSRAHRHGNAAGGAGPKSDGISLTLLQELPALVWRSNDQGACDWFNATWLEFTGRTLEDELSDGWLEGVHPDDRQRCIYTWLQNFAARRPFVMEYRLMHHEGEYRWIRDFGRPVSAADGTFMGYIGACFDINDLRQLAEDLSHLAAHDPLTGLPDRRAFEVAVIEATAAARRGMHSTILFADLDRFKECNDRFGHDKGDAVLVEIAQVMRLTVRDMDMVARIGGDEFGVLLRGQSGAEVGDIEERLGNAVAECGARYGLDIGLSIGASAIDGDHTASVVLAEADSRMYESKRRQVR